MNTPSKGAIRPKSAPLYPSTVENQDSILAGLQHIINATISPTPWTIEIAHRLGQKNSPLDVHVMDAQGKTLVWCGWVNPHASSNAKPCHPSGVLENAALIAAAPELLAALENLLARADRLSGLTETKDWPEQAAAREAIAKATGREGA